MLSRSLKRTSTNRQKRRRKEHENNKKRRPFETAYSLQTETERSLVLSSGFGPLLQALQKMFRIAAATEAERKSAGERQHGDETGDQRLDDRCRNGELRERGK